MHDLNKCLERHEHRGNWRELTAQPANEIAEIPVYDLHLDGSGEELAFDILRTPY